MKLEQFKAKAKATPFNGGFHNREGINYHLHNMTASLGNKLRYDGEVDSKLNQYWDERKSKDAKLISKSAFLDIIKLF